MLAIHMATGHNPGAPRLRSNLPNRTINQTGRAQRPDPSSQDRHQGKIDAASPETVRLARKLHSLESAVYRKKAQIQRLKERKVKNERVGTEHTLQTA